MNRNKLKWIYLFFSIIGLIIPWYYNIHFMLINGPASFTMPSYFGAGMASDLAASITTDFFIGSIPVLIWMMVEAKKLRIKYRWLYFAGTFILAFSFTCPLFLFFREIKMQEKE